MMSYEGADNAQNPAIRRPFRPRVMLMIFAVFVVICASVIATDRLSRRLRIAPNAATAAAAGTGPGAAR